MLKVHGIQRPQSAVMLNWNLNTCRTCLW
jgi:hypothetical protein